LKLLMGNPGMRPLTYPAPPSAGPGDAPEHLTAAQKVVFLELLARAPQGLLQPCDVFVIECIAVNTVIARKLADLIAKKGPLQKDRVHGGQERQAAWLKAYRNTVALLVRLYAAIGYTPAARSSIHLPPETGELTKEEREFQGLLG